MLLINKFYYSNSEVKIKKFRKNFLLGTFLKGFGVTGFITTGLGSEV